MRWKLSAFVKYDLAEIGRYVGQESSVRAEKLLKLLLARSKEIAKQPLLYRLRPELGLDIRLAPVGQYVILFRIRGKLVRIERIVHGGRDLLALLDEIDSLPPK